MTVVRASRPARRQGAALAVFLVLALALLLGLTAAMWLTGGEARRCAAAALVVRPAAAVPTLPTVPPGGVAVNVLNSSDRSGLASTIARDLRARGFAVGDVGNVPAGQAPRSAAEIRHGKRGRAAAITLAKYVPGAVLKADGRSGTRIDLVLGASFTNIVDPPGTPTPTPSAAVAPPPRPSSTPTC